MLLRQSLPVSAPYDVVKQSAVHTVIRLGCLLCWKKKVMRADATV